MQLIDYFRVVVENYDCKPFCQYLVIACNIVA